MTTIALRRRARRLAALLGLGLALLVAVTLPGAASARPAIDPPAPVSAAPASNDQQPAPAVSSPDDTQRTIALVVAGVALLVAVGGLTLSLRNRQPHRV